MVRPAVVEPGRKAARAPEANGLDETCGAGATLRGAAAGMGDMPDLIPPRWA